MLNQREFKEKEIIELIEFYNSRESEKTKKFNIDIWKDLIRTSCKVALDKHIEEIRAAVQRQSIRLSKEENVYVTASNEYVKEAIERCNKKHEKALRKLGEE